MTHSHLVVNHLLKQVENFRARKIQRDVRPEWVTRLIDQAADLFEPYEDIARVGFHCQLAEDRWELGLYLGVTELVGGNLDGDARYTNFEFDLQRLMGLFDQVTECRWRAFPEPQVPGTGRAHSLVSVLGEVAGQPVLVNVFSMPPQDAGPGLRQFPNGEFETV